MSQKQNEQELTEYVGVETRSRSRSKTPSRVLKDVRDAKVPSVDTIVEEVDEPHMTKKLKQSHVSSEEVVSSTTTVVTSTVRKTKSKEAVRRSNQISPKKLTKSTRKSKEVTQNEENMLLETSIESIRQNASTNGSPSMNFAYKEYVEAGEYWNKYPKTDYTYSELSAYRREVAPGTIGMPNMSRKSLELHHDRVVTMIQKNPEEESFIRKRYQAASVAPPPTFATSLQYDSGDELDYNHFQRKTVLSSSLVQRQTIIRRVWTLITTIVTTIVYFPVQVFKKSDESLYRTRYEEKGFLTRTYERLCSVLFNVLKRVYLIVSTILLWDTWLLMIRTNVVRDTRRRRFLLLLLFLLPLLLLGGIFYRLLILEYLTLWYKNSREKTLVSYNYVKTLNYDKIQSDVVQGFKSAQEITNDTLIEIASAIGRATNYLHETITSIKIT